MEQPKPKQNIVIDRIFNRLYVHLPDFKIRDSISRQARIFGDTLNWGDFTFTLQVATVYDVQEVIDYLESLVPES